VLNGRVFAERILAGLRTNALVAVESPESPEE
jgi:hypothetical protein